jgi:hypothetical protein
LNLERTLCCARKFSNQTGFSNAKLIQFHIRNLMQAGSLSNFRR